MKISSKQRVYIDENTSPRVALDQAVLSKKIKLIWLSTAIA